jgi:hypothetical protein
MMATNLCLVDQMADLVIAAAAFGTPKGKAPSRAASMKDHGLFLRFRESARVERVIVGDLGTVAFRRCQLVQMAEVVDRRHGFVSARPTQHQTELALWLSHQQRMGKKIGPG